MNCKSTAQLLSAYVDRELSGEAMLQVRTHLHQCPACLQELEIMKAMKESFSLLADPEPSPEFSARMREAVFSQPVPSRGIVWPNFRLASLCAVAAGLGALLAIRYADSGPKPDLSASKGVPYEIARDQAFSAGGDPLNGHFPVMPASHDIR